MRDAGAPEIRCARLVLTTREWTGDWGGVFLPGTLSHPPHPAPMLDPSGFLQNLALVLVVAAATTVLFQRFRQPVLFGYLLAGMIVGPYVPIPVLADREMIRAFSDLGVTLLMFSIGLEFSLRRLADIGAAAGTATLVEVGVMMGLGFLMAQLFGWTLTESLVTGAMFAFSSTTIAIKALNDQGRSGRFVEIVYGILIVEDLVAILVLAVLAAVAAGGGLSPAEFTFTAARLVVFLVVLIATGYLLVPRLIRWLARQGHAETMLVTSVAICFATALLALTFGYSIALGAFLAGSLIAESGHAAEVARLVRPLRDLFVAIFFIAVGMLIDPAMVVAHWPAVLAFSALVVVGKVLAVSVSAFLVGGGLRPSVQAGMSLAQIGEFSFLIAAMGVSSGSTRGFLYPVAVAVSALTTLGTPWLIRRSGDVARWVDHWLPAPLQTFGALYGSWFERLRAAPRGGGGAARTRRLVKLLLLDAAVLIALIIGLSVEFRRLAAWLGRSVEVSDRVVLGAILAAALVVATPLVIGAVRTARLLAMSTAVRALPATHPGQVDLARAPRSAMVVTLELGIVLAVAVVIAVVTQPFLPSLPALALIVPVLGIFGLVFWRSAKHLEGHARAGAEVIVAALAQQGNDASPPDQVEQTMARVRTMLPGLGEPVPLRVDVGSRLADRPLAESDLRSVTGATILAVVRPGSDVLAPNGMTVLLEGDILVVAGTRDAIEAARELAESEVVPPDETRLPTR